MLHNSEFFCYARQSLEIRWTGGQGSEVKSKRVDDLLTELDNERRHVQRRREHYKIIIKGTKSCVRR